MTKQTKQNRKGQIKKLGPIGKVSQLDDDQKEAEEINGGGESTQLLLRERKKERKKERKSEKAKIKSVSCGDWRILSGNGCISDLYALLSKVARPIKRRPDTHSHTHTHTHTHTPRILASLYTHQKRLSRLGELRGSGGTIPI